jgi:hypothetical protein
MAPAQVPVFVDAISGQHASPDPHSLLQQRKLTFSKDFGWQYDVWVDDPLKYALSGANSRSVVVCQRTSSLSVLRDCQPACRGSFQSTAAMPTVTLPCCCAGSPSLASPNGRMGSCRKQQRVLASTGTAGCSSWHSRQARLDSSSSRSRSREADGPCKAWCGNCCDNTLVQAK